MSTLAKYPKATMITIWTLGAFLGTMHIFFGLVSLTPAINQDYFREMKINFNAYAKSLTFLHQFIDRAVLALYLRYFVSIAQIVFGALLLENGHFGGVCGKVGNIALIFLNSKLVLLKLLVGTSLDRLSPTLVYTVLLIARVLIVAQNARKPRVGAKTRYAGKPKTSTPKKNKNE